ncbi:RNA-binding domain-containing protein [Marinagarivorans algicola]|uniref:RNA-binding domain-containing protein n=1 Tax=Marinagarivorans algicola TaxID=1513270 RepID=UPI0006B8AFA5|nr:RNA-binding domain-containing protein [Marinagarivorans algicola]
MGCEASSNTAPNKEGRQLEFKRQLTDSLEKKGVAFLNSRDGGAIVIGVDDNGQTLGVDDADALQLKIKDRLKHNILPSIMGLFDVVAFEQEGKTVVKIILASGSEKPYYLTKMGMSPKGCFLRIGSASEPMPPAMIEQLFSQRVRNSIGNMASRYQDLSFEQLKIYYNDNGQTLNAQFARNLELLNKDGDYNYAAYLLSDNNGCSIKVAKYAGVDRVDLVENEEYGYCCLVKASKAVLDKLAIENRTFTKITPKERIEKKQINAIALREAVINAIIHNDYSREVPPKFELFSDRLEITSAGVIPAGLSEADFFKGYSIPQNKELMRVFRDLELVEQLGSGIPRILQTYSPAIYHFSPSFIRVVFNFAADDNATMQATMQATPQAEAVLAFCKSPQSRTQIQEHLGLKNRDHFRKAILQPLLESGVLLQTLPDKPTSPKQQFYTAPDKGELL